MVEAEGILNSMLNARSVAIIGVSSNPEKDGHQTLKTLIDGGYKGKIYPVNPRGGKILGLEVYTSVNEIPDTVDLAMIIVRADITPQAVKEVAAKGAKGAIILSAGFREAGRRDLEEDLKRAAAECSLRFMGPNIQGVTYTPNKLCAAFWPAVDLSGPLAIVSQSGTVTAALTEWAEDDGVGIHSAFNLGNQADLCEVDYLEFLVYENRARAVMLYLEGVSDGPRFDRAFRRLAPRLRLAVLKGGRSSLGKKSVVSHTGALAGSYRIFEAACRQFGALAVPDLVRLYNTAKALAMMEPPRGNRLMIISSSGGANTLSVDKAQELGLVLPSLPEGAEEKFKAAGVWEMASLGNPTDLVSNLFADFEAAITTADELNLVDVILINFGDPVVGGAEMMVDLSRRVKVPLVLSYLGGGSEQREGRLIMHRAGIPVFPTPEQAIEAISSSVLRAAYHANRKKINGNSNHE